MISSTDEAPLVSVITPTNGSQFLTRALDGVKAQTYPCWEWIVLANGPAAAADLSFVQADTRVRVVRDHSANDKIGYWKKAACEIANGDIIVELDHDDSLLPHALNTIVDAFKTDPEVGMVYSNNAAIHADWTPNQEYDSVYGWKYRDRTAFGHQVRECVAPQPWPQNLSRIWYAPDHVRAWWANTYRAIGGHNPDMDVCDDHDLICRMYIKSKIKHIDDLLYLYTVHDSNNVKLRNALIQETTWAIYHRYVEQMAMRWAADNGLKALLIDGGVRRVTEREPSYTAVGFSNEESGSCCDPVGPETVADRAEMALSMLGALPGDSAGIIRLDDALHLFERPIEIMKQSHRVLAHGGFLFSSTPSTDGRGAWQDPRARSGWNQNSFWYWTDPGHQRQLGMSCPWQDVCTNTWFPTEWHRATNVPYVVSHLIAIKDGPRFHGLNLFRDSE